MSPVGLLVILSEVINFLVNNVVIEDGIAEGFLLTAARATAGTRPARTLFHLILVDEEENNRHYQ